MPCSLTPHAYSSAVAVSGIEVDVDFADSGELNLKYCLDAHLGALRIPEARAGDRADGLWRHTCFEAFIQGDDAPAYREFNLSPSGQWQAYAFTRYRDGGLLQPAPPPSRIRSDEKGRLTLMCRLPASLLPPGRTLDLGLAAVIEATDGGLSYWALRHPPGEPDFHHGDGFALSLQRP